MKPLPPDRGSSPTIQLKFYGTEDHTKLILTHSGWKSSEDYQKAREWHANWWPNVLKKLQEYLVK